MATIQERKAQTGKSSYTAIIRLKGYPTQTATFDKKSNAKAWAQQTEASIKHGKYFKTAEAQKHTLSDLIDRYVENDLNERKTNQHKVKMQLYWWKHQLGEYFLADITPALISQYRDKLQKEPIKFVIDNDGEKKPKYRSNATINRYMAALSFVYTIAVNEWEWLEENPMKKVKKKSEPRGRVRFLSDKERNALLKACNEASSPYLYTVVAIALSTGARFSEIMSVKWSDIDFDRHVIRFMDTKNGENKAIPISSKLYKLLQAQYVRRKLGSRYVFARADGKRPIDIRKHWNRAIKEAGIDDFRFHDLRHSAASYLAMNGATLLELSHILGHKTLQMVKRYAHLTTQHTADLIERMNKQAL